MKAPEVTVKVTPDMSEFSDALRGISVVRPGDRLIVTFDVASKFPGEPALDRLREFVGPDVEVLFLHSATVTVLTGDLRKGTP